MKNPMYYNPLDRNLYLVAKAAEFDIGDIGATSFEVTANSRVLFVFPKKEGFYNKLKKKKNIRRTSNKFNKNS